MGFELEQPRDAEKYSYHQAGTQGSILDLFGNGEISLPWEAR
jgi:hypothetical protein